MIKVKIAKLLGEPGSMKRKSSSGLMWLTAGNAVRGLLGVVIAGLLARVLGASPIGSFALILSVMSFAALIADAGVTSALIQRKEIDDEDVRASHSYTMAQSSSVAALLCLLAYPITLILHQQRLIIPLIVVATSLPINAWGNTSAALLKRDMRHKFNQWCNFAAFVVGQGLVALPLAKFKWGIWALVWGTVAQAIISSSLQWSLTRHSVKPCWKRDKTSFTFTWSILVQNLANWCLSFFDSLAVGGAAGTTMLGWYNRGRWLIETPLGMVVPSIQDMVVSTTSRAQEDVKRVRGIMVKGILLSFAITVPVSVCAIIFPKQIVLLVLGQKFLPTAALLPIFAVERLFMSVLAQIGPALTGFGRPDFEAKVSLSLVPLAVLTLPFSAHYGLKYVAMNLAAVTCVRMLIKLFVAWRFFWHTH